MCTGEQAMYLLSPGLQERIHAIAAEAEMRSDHRVRYEECIALPFFGQIVLRFTLDQEDVSLADLDAYETMLNAVAGGEFLMDFMGAVYRKAGLDPAGLENRLTSLCEEMPKEEIPPTVHADGIRRDAEYLLRSAGMDTGLPVWEIQPEEGEWTVLILGRDHRSLKEACSNERITVLETAERPCAGLVRAALYARRNHVSLARVLLEKQADA